MRREPGAAATGGLSCARPTPEYCTVASRRAGAVQFAFTTPPQDHAHGRVAMPIKIKCPKCQKGLNVPDSLAGKQGPCPLCKRIIKVPMPTSAQKQDWRKAAARPTGARMDQAAPEGAWGSTTDRSHVHGESLEEADAIPVKRDPVTARQWVAR